MIWELSLGLVGGASGMERGVAERGLERRQGHQDGSEGPGEVMDFSLLLLEWPPNLPRALPQAGQNPG